ncbi:predicted protein [Naegleria gruberi]|uniref:Predicted protein n=1 Tax=Naegleria gruberi TaxID=5762 RepID=D2V450_NAEGR|nr:uncharacterized protein NAEGRDRAFT_63598 [Naegleria gruberi]EFC48458.1 predicted protein [Naegleria gruberi]|eukprot:XP_002681202.1 predicted protein [Naegleria gruberi strain NEG-M]
MATSSFRNNAGGGGGGSNPHYQQQQHTTHLHSSMYLSTIESASLKAERLRVTTSPFARTDFAIRRDLSQKPSEVVFSSSTTNLRSNDTTNNNNTLTHSKQHQQYTNRSSISSSSSSSKQYTNKEDYSLLTIDKPQQLIPQQVHKTNTFNLNNDDIEGSKPLKNNVIFNRQLNPLNPIYKLPSVRQPTRKPPEFELFEKRPPKDILKVDDIIYDENKKLANERKKNSIPRDPITCDDINHPEDYGDFAVRGFYRSDYQKRIPEKHKIDKINVKDINDEWKFSTRRSTNPLSPRYDYEKSNIGREIGEIEGSKPATLPKQSNWTREPLLETRGNCGHALSSTFPIQRRDFRQINYVQDILHDDKKGNYTTFHIPSKRQTHPLDPNY